MNWNYCQRKLLILKEIYEKEPRPELKQSDSKHVLLLQIKFKLSPNIAKDPKTPQWHKCT